MNAWWHVLTHDRPVKSATMCAVTSLANPFFKKIIQSSATPSLTAAWKMIIELDQHLIVSVKSDFMSKCIMVTQEWVHFLLGCVKRACWNTLRYTHCCFSELTPVHSLCCAHGRSETCSVLSLNPASYLCTHTHLHYTHRKQISSRLFDGLI